MVDYSTLMRLANWAETSTSNKQQQQQWTANISISDSIERVWQHNVLKSWNI